MWSLFNASPPDEPYLFVIKDDEEWPIDAKYAREGVSKGWLTLINISRNENNVLVMYYRHEGT